jgi:hypothetical protein
MFDEREDINGNLFLIYVLNNIDLQDINNFIQVKNLELNYDNKDIYISYVNSSNKNVDYRLFENRLNIEKIVNYNNIINDIKYLYPIIIFSKNIDTIVKNSQELISEKETYGIIGE